MSYNSLNSNISYIQNFYVGKTVFLTGASGTLGKLVLEKLLRCCGDLKRIYVLMRDKRGVKSEERLREMFSSEVSRKL